MIQIHESSSWIAQHSILIDFLNLLLLALSSGAIIAMLVASAPNPSKGFSKRAKITLGIAIPIAICSIGFILANLNTEPRYSGSGTYTVEKAQTQSSGKQIIVVNDGKNDVKLSLQDNDEGSYSKGDKIRVNIESYSSKAEGKHDLSYLIGLGGNKFSGISYEIEKVK